MNHAANSTAVTDASARAAGGSWRALAVLGGVSIVLAPLAAWQFGVAGVGLVVALAVVIAATNWIVRALEVRIVRAGHPVAAPLAASGLRMTVPLAAALLVVTLGSQFVPVAGVLLLVPLYLSALLAETSDHVRPRGITNAA